MSDTYLAEAACAIATDVGAWCLERFLDADAGLVEMKGPADFVSSVDRGAEDLARQRLVTLTPGISIVGEENGGEPADEFWVLDPLDGTTNFLSGLPIWGVSIALMRKGRPVLGAIAAPALGFAICGGENAPIAIRGQLGRMSAGFGGLVAVGRNPQWPAAERAELERQLEADGLTIVSLGSCAVSLALVALGRLHGYVEAHSRLWDCAAGTALCRAAGLPARLEMLEGDFAVSIDAGVSRDNPVSRPRFEF